MSEIVILAVCFQLKQLKKLTHVYPQFTYMIFIYSYSIIIIVIIIIITLFL